MPVQSQVQPGKGDTSLSVELSIDRETIAVGGEIKVAAAFSPAVSDPAQGYKWQVVNTNVAALSVQSDFTARVVGKEVGVTDVVLTYGG